MTTQLGKRAALGALAAAMALAAGCSSTEPETTAPETTAVETTTTTTETTAPAATAPPTVTGTPSEPDGAAHGAGVDPAHPPAPGPAADAPAGSDADGHGGH